MFKEWGVLPKASFVLVIIGFLLVAMLGVYTLYHASQKKATIYATNLDQTKPVSTVYADIAQKGAPTCNQVSDEVLRRECLNIAIKLEATQKGDASICDGAAGESFIRQCKRDVISKQVAQQYFKEVQAKGNPNITPSNIALCTQLAYAEDREYCLNPHNYPQLCTGGAC